MSLGRWSLMVMGAAMMLVGLLQLRSADGSQLLSLARWLAGGVLVHDAVLAPLTIAVVAIGVRLVPPAARRTAVVGLVVWGTVTIAAANVLLGVGGRPDNDTLLNRPYLEWWTVLTVAWWAGVGVVGFLLVRRRGGWSAPLPDDRRT